MRVPPTRVSGPPRGRTKRGLGRWRGNRPRVLTKPLPRLSPLQGLGVPAGRLPVPSAKAKVPGSVWGPGQKAGRPPGVALPTPRAAGSVSEPCWWPRPERPPCTGSTGVPGSAPAWLSELALAVLTTATYSCQLANRTSPEVTPNRTPEPSRAPKEEVASLGRERAPVYQLGEASRGPNGLPGCEGQSQVDGRVSEMWVKPGQARPGAGPTVGPRGGWAGPWVVSEAGKGAPGQALSHLLGEGPQEQGQMRAGARLRGRCPLSSRRLPRRRPWPRLVWLRVPGNT